MTEQVHADLDNGFVHRSDGSVLPIVAMLDRGRERTDQAEAAIMVVAGTERAGFLVVAVNGYRLECEEAAIN